MREEIQDLLLLQLDLAGPHGQCDRIGIDRVDQRMIRICGHVYIAKRRQRQNGPAQVLRKRLDQIFDPAASAQEINILYLDP